jgi:hypothetical protein
MPGLLQSYCELQLPRRDCRTDECEDAAAGNPTTGRFAVADGAAESFNPALWARLLVEEFVATGMGPDWQARLRALQARWFQTALPPGEDPANLPWYQEAQFREGAFATILGLMLQADGDSSCDWHALAVGDSCLFQVRDGKLLEAFPVARAADFGNTPWLIGSRTKPPRIKRRHGKGQPGDRFWLMTDALAAWFLRGTEAGERPWERLQKLERRSDVKKAFREWIAGLRGQRWIRDDDVTLVAVLL